MFMKRILVVDDDRASCNLLRELFTAQGWSAETAETPGRALELAAREKFDLLVSDINLEAEISGLDLLREMRDRAPVVLITGFGALDTTVAASREGAWDIISKPFKVQEIIAVARRALERSEESGKGDVAAPEADRPKHERAGMAGLIGRSPAMLELYKEIARVAGARSTVLIIGESGTGKELVARSIHQHSDRASRPFVPVNCGALT
jgi:DNA-binding NtrC family response regulator